MNCKYSLRRVVAAVIAATLAVTTMTASAGGVFGKGGLIRGDVGKWGDKHIDRKVTPVVKPIAQAAAVVTCGTAAFEATGNLPAAAIAGSQCSKLVK